MAKRISRQTFITGVITTVGAGALVGCSDEAGEEGTGGTGGTSTGGGNTGGGTGDGTGGTDGMDGTDMGGSGGEAMDSGGSGGEATGGSGGEATGGSGGEATGGEGGEATDGEGGEGGMMQENACMDDLMLDENNGITSMHPHGFTVPVADIEAGMEKTYDMSGDHPHSVTLTAMHFEMLAAGETVMVTSTGGGGGNHTHEVEISCA